MKKILLCLGTAFFVSWCNAEQIVSSTPAAEEDDSSKAEFSHEFHTEYSYSGKSDVSQGEKKLGEMDAQNNVAKYILSHSITDSVYLRWGVNWERFSFSTPESIATPAGKRAACQAAAPAPPDTLQSLAAVIGADIELSDEWVMRVEIEPGIYSDWRDISFDDINMPTIIGASYLVDKDLQWFFGVGINPRSSFLPVMPGVGVRWKFADQWTLFLVLPNPKIEYEIIKDLTLYAGMSIKGGNYQVSKKYGDSRNRFDLDNDNVSYREIRTGGGLGWKFMEGMTIEAEGGWTIDRRFDFAQSDLIIDSDGAPYGQVGFSAAF
ncbi:MAG: DUF6268 family outer membrane beta-barrel protein [Verrucomicrobiota bacterium]